MLGSQPSISRWRPQGLVSSWLALNRLLQLSGVGFQLLQDVLDLGVKLAGAGLRQLLAELREAASSFAVQLGLAPGLPALLFLTR